MLLLRSSSNVGGVKRSSGQETFRQSVVTPGEWRENEHESVKRQRLEVPNILVAGCLRNVETLRDVCCPGVGVGISQSMNNRTMPTCGGNSSADFRLGDRINSKPAMSDGNGGPLLCEYSNPLQQQQQHQTAAPSGSSITSLSRRDVINCSRCSCSTARCHCGLTVYRSKRHSRRDKVVIDEKKGFESALQDRLTRPSTSLGLRHRSHTSSASFRLSSSAEVDSGFQSRQSPVTCAGDVTGNHVTPCQPTVVAELDATTAITSSRLADIPDNPDNAISALTLEIGGLSVDEQTEVSSDDLHQHILVGREKFNVEAKTGIEYLQFHGLVGRTPTDVAQFLLKGEGLSKRVTGEFISEKSPLSSDVLKAYVNLYDFNDMDFLQALRRFLGGFRLPGEAQKIDRVLECFAQRYCQLNPDVFTCQDACHSVSFATIMLNTSLHNPNVKDRLTPDAFLSINSAQSLSTGFLMKLYIDIKAEPLRVPAEEAARETRHPFKNPIKFGWLCKRGGKHKSWKKRWFVLNDRCLYYFQFSTDRMPKGIIPLENLSLRDVVDRLKPHCFELYTNTSAIIKACKTNWDGRVVQGHHRVFRMSAASSDEQQEWMRILRIITSEAVPQNMLPRR